MRTIGVVTVARSDYGIYRPILQKIVEHPALELRVIVSGMHLSSAYGLTVNQIEADGFRIHYRVAMPLGSDTPAGIATSMGIGIIAFSQVFEGWQPDILVVLGDRFDMSSAALAALPFNIPVAHIHGGEVTAGAIDDALRHTITKLSHLHFVSTEMYARRVIQLGEEPWRVTVSGAPGLDNLANLTLLTPSELTERYHLDLSRPPLLVTFHPVTRETDQVAYQVGELLSALEASGIPLVFTLPNADTNAHIIIQGLRNFIAGHPTARIVENFGTAGYFSMMAYASAMVGNSSSGIIEAPSFGLPVVNIGTRQAGRVRAANVIDVDYTRKAILAGIQQAISPAFRVSLRDITNPYGNGHAASIIVDRLASIEIDKRLFTKLFYDLPAWGGSAR